MSRILSFGISSPLVAPLWGESHCRGRSRALASLFLLARCCCPAWGRWVQDGPSSSDQFNDFPFCACGNVRNRVRGILEQVGGSQRAVWEALLICPRWPQIQADMPGRTRAVPSLPVERGSVERLLALAPSTGHSLPGGAGPVLCDLAISPRRLPYS